MSGRHDTSTPPRPVNALLLDDDDAIRSTFAALLEEAGYRVVEAASLADARRRIAENDFALAVLDLRLPDGIGSALVPDLQRRQPAPVIALLTGMTMPPGPGVDLVLSKGGDPAQHLRALAAAMTKRGLEPPRRLLDRSHVPPSGVHLRAGRGETPRLGTAAITSRPAGARGRVLVVDDEPAARASLEALLEGEFDVETASNVREAEARLARTSFDVVITDYVMPGERGTVLLERLRNIPGVVGMLVTGHADFDHVRDARHDPEVFQVLLKPYQPDVLLHRVRSALTIAHVRQARIGRTS